MKNKVLKVTDRTLLLLTPPLWSNLRRLGTSKILRTSYFWLVSVPFLAKVLDKIPNTFAFYIQEQAITLTLSLPFSLTLFYLTAVFLSISSLIFDFFCPCMIKNYSNPNEYLADGRTTKDIVYDFVSLMKSRTTLSHKQNDTTFKLDHFANTYTDIYFESTNSVPITNEYKLSQISEANLTKDTYPQAFWYVYREYDNTHYLSRLLSVGCYAAALLSLLLIGISSLTAVIKATDFPMYFYLF